MYESCCSVQCKRENRVCMLGSEKAVVVEYERGELRVQVYLALVGL